MKKWSRHLLAAGALAIGMSAAHADDSKTLYFYNWTEYVPPGLLEQFTKETGIKVIYSTYESNETMYAKLKTYKDGAYDLVVPSTDCLPNGDIALNDNIAIIHSIGRADEIIVTADATQGKHQSQH